MWILFTYTHKIKNTFGRLLVKILFIGALAGGSLFFMQSLSSELGRYSLENVVQTSNVTRGWIYYSSGDEGSAYDLGNFDPTLTGMLSKFPLAVNVTLFRPYLWESKKIIMAFSAIEAFLFLFLTLKILFTIKPATIWRTISHDPTIQFCFVFSFIFAFAVGISSYNFGLVVPLQNSLYAFLCSWNNFDLLQKRSKREKTIGAFGLDDFIAQPI